MAVGMSDVQTVDLNRIREFFAITGQEASANKYGILAERELIRPMVTELLDLVEGSTLLQDAAKARLDAMYQDAAVDNPAHAPLLKDIQSLDPDNPDDREKILPRQY